MLALEAQLNRLNWDPDVGQQLSGGPCLAKPMGVATVGMARYWMQLPKIWQQNNKQCTFVGSGTGAPFGKLLGTKVVDWSIVTMAN